MAQPSILNYFNNRKRSALEDTKIERARKVLVLDSSEADVKSEIFASDNNIKPDMGEKTISVLQTPKIVMPPCAVKSTKKVIIPKVRRTKVEPKSGPIEHLLTNLGRDVEESAVSTLETAALKNEQIKDLGTKPAIAAVKHKLNRSSRLAEIKASLSQMKQNMKQLEPTVLTLDTEAPKNDQQVKTPTNALDRMKDSGAEPSIAALKHKLSRSSRLAEIKASLSRFKENEKKLEAAERRTLSLKNFKNIELEVNVSPTKPQSPQKSYLSPIKNTSVSKNLFSVPPSPTKNAVAVQSSPSKLVTSVIKDKLTLPYKYRRIAEVFRGIDTICQILHNRKETITFKKLKPSVEQMLKITVTTKHLSQIKHIYPEAFHFQQEKMREYGAGNRREHWELVVTPQIKNETTMTAQVLLDRRRQLFSILVEKVKDYHDEFLATFDPPMKVVRAEVKHWHPQFDIEKVPDIELSPVPEPPTQEHLTSGTQVLEKARNLFNCNTKMERALEKLKEARAEQVQMPEPELKQGSILKGIPKALLEKVRQRQAAKALESMTRSADKEKEAQLYSRLPEIARLTRNLFVSEKKNIMPLEIVVEKLCKSSKIFLTKSEIELYVKTIAKEETEWIKLELVRSAYFVKIFKNYDVSLVLSKLQKLADEKMT